jgi:hypothetical protein
MKNKIENVYYTPDEINQYNQNKSVYIYLFSKNLKKNINNFELSNFITDNYIIDIYYIDTYIKYYDNIINPPNTTCPISLTSFQNNSRVCVIRGCRHIFNKESIYTWLRTNPRCPVCRYDVRNYSTINQMTDTSNDQDNESFSDYDSEGSFIDDNNNSQH